MSLGTILLLLLAVALVGALPTWSHSAGWGYLPSGGIAVVVAIIVVLVMTGQIAI